MSSIDQLVSGRLATWYDNIKYSAVVKSCENYVSNLCEASYVVNEMTIEVANYYRRKYTREIESYTDAIKRSYILANGNIEPLLKVLAKCIKTAVIKRADELNLGDYLSVFNTKLESLMGVYAPEEETETAFSSGNENFENAESNQNVEAVNLQQPKQIDKKIIRQEEEIRAKEEKQQMAANVAKERLERLNTIATASKNVAPKIQESTLIKAKPVTTQVVSKPTTVNVVKEQPDKVKSVTPQVSKGLGSTGLGSKISLGLDESNNEETLTSIKQQTAKTTDIGSATGGLNDISRLHNLTETDDK